MPTNGKLAGVSGQLSRPASLCPPQFRAGMGNYKCQIGDVTQDAKLNVFHIKAPENALNSIFFPYNFEHMVIYPGTQIKSNLIF